MYLIIIFVKSLYYWENNIKYLIGLNIGFSIKFNYIFLKNFPQAAQNYITGRVRPVGLLLATPDLFFQTVIISLFLYLIVSFSYSTSISHLMVTILSSQKRISQINHFHISLKTLCFSLPHIFTYSPLILAIPFT
jgi:hypothetical protein